MEKFSKKRKQTNHDKERTMSCNNNHSEKDHHLNGGCSSSSSSSRCICIRNDHNHQHHPPRLVEHDNNMMILNCRRRRRSHHCFQESLSSSLLLWQKYKEWVYRNEVQLYWMDDVISRLLWWIPSAGSETGCLVTGDDDQQHYNSRWPRREIIWGLLQLHRLFVDLALEEKYQHDNANSRHVMHNGTTLRLKGVVDDVDDDDDYNNYQITSHRLRIGLDIIQSLWPVALELASIPLIMPNNTNMNQWTIIRQRRQAAIGLVLERVRFILKMYFLIQYWKQWNKQQRKQETTATTTSSSRILIVPPGIMQMGSLLTTASSLSFTTPTLEQERARLERANYVGRRTGRRVVAAAVSPLATTANTARSTSLRVGMENDSSLLTLFGYWKRIKSFLLSLSSNLVNNNNNTTRTVMMMMRLVVGEFLYVFRPLFWAQAQWDGYNHEYIVQQMTIAAASQVGAGVENPIIDTARHSTTISSSSSSSSSLSWLWKAWLISLGMDITSLMCLSNMATNTSNDRNSSSLHHNNNNNINPATVQEWKRRRLRLLLYLLRSPVWEVYMEHQIIGSTSSTMEQHPDGGDMGESSSLSGRLSRHVPLVGGLLATYLQDWLYYWKVYRAEEG